MDEEYSSLPRSAVEGGFWLRIRRFFDDYGDDLFLIVCIILVALAAFGLGRYSVLRESHRGFEIVYPEEQQAAAVAAIPQHNFVASLSGTKYHLPSCSGAKRIQEENKIWFATREEAEVAGYEPATNCPGL